MLTRIQIAADVQGAEMLHNIVEQMGEEREGRVRWWARSDRHRQEDILSKCLRYLFPRITDTI